MFIPPLPSSYRNKFTKFRSRDRKRQKAKLEKSLERQKARHAAAASKLPRVSEQKRSSKSRDLIHLIKKLEAMERTSRLTKYDVEPPWSRGFIASTSINRWC